MFYDFITLKLFVEKMIEALTMQKFLTFFSTKNIGIFEKLTHEKLTNDIVSFEQSSPVTMVNETDVCNNSSRTAQVQPQISTTRAL